MSIELHILSDGRLASIAEWQRAIDAKGYALLLSPDVELQAARGFIPALLRGRKTRFECYHDNANDIQDFLELHRSTGPWKFALGFRYIGDEAEQTAAWMAATAYAWATAGIVFDPQEGRTFTPDETAEVVRQLERDAPRVEAALKEIIGRLYSKK